MNTALFIAGRKADLSGDSATMIDLSISDLREPVSRTASRSRTILLPPTANNHRVFKDLFIVNKDNNFFTFNPAIKVPAWLINGNSAILEGELQLLRITNGSYEVVIYSQEKALFSLMGDRYITNNTDSGDDVDLDTTANVVNVDASAITEAVTSGFVASSNVCAGMWIDNGEDREINTTYPYYHLWWNSQRLAVKFKHIWDCIFQHHSQRYSSAFMDTDLFKAMVYIDTHGTLPKLSEAERNDLSFVANRALTSTFNPLPERLKADNEVRDDGGSYDPLIYLYTAPESRWYNITINSLFQNRLYFTGNQVVGSPTTSVFTIYGKIAVNGSYVPALEKSTTVTFQVPAASYVTSDTIAGGNRGFAWSDPIFLNAGDTIYIDIESSNLSGPISNTRHDIAQMIGTQFRIDPASNEIGNGAQYLPSKAIAYQHKQVDFITDVLKMFNMYLLYDDNNGYIVEPRDDFFELGTVRDWTMKVDRSKDFEIIPIAEQTWKVLQFKPALDKDYYSDTYNKSTGRVYGQENVENNNEFVRDTKTVELTFAPPLTASASTSYPKLQHIYTLGSSGSPQRMDGKPRYGIWAGWKEPDTVFWRVKNEDTSYSDVIYGYPFVGEFDDPNDPTQSVLFGPPQQIFYASALDVAITDNDLYSFHSNEIENQTNINAKTLRCWMYLSPNDIQLLKMYDRIIVDGVKFIISSITGYDPANPSPVQVSLIQYEQ